LWRSFQRYDARCSLRTWTYRVAHHVAVSYVMRERRILSTLVSLEELEMLPDKDQGQFAANQRISLDRLSALIQRLKPLDRQVIVSYLEDMDAASIAEVTGLSPGSVAMRIHRIKNVLAKRFHEGGSYAG
jgi:RNA polymerase sigma-70 factor (ECF subfamily)